MAVNTHEHAGNNDERRQLQSTDAARCQICQFHEGQEIPGKDEKVTLSSVELKDGKKSIGTFRVCQFCNELHGTDVSAIRQMMRSQPVEQAVSETELPTTEIPGVGGIQL